MAVPRVVPRSDRPAARAMVGLSRRLDHPGVCRSARTIPGPFGKPIATFTGSCSLSPPWRCWPGACGSAGGCKPTGTAPFLSTTADQHSASAPARPAKIAALKGTVPIFVDHGRPTLRVGARAVPAKIGTVPENRDSRHRPPADNHPGDVGLLAVALRRAPKLTYGIIASSASWAVLVSFAEKKVRWLTLTTWAILALLPAGDIEKALLHVFPAAMILLPIGVVLFLVWLVWHERLLCLGAWFYSARSAVVKGDWLRRRDQALSCQTALPTTVPVPLLRQAPGDACGKRGTVPPLWYKGAILPAISPLTNRPEFGQSRNHRILIENAPPWHGGHRICKFVPVWDIS